VNPRLDHAFRDLQHRPIYSTFDNIVLTSPRIIAQPVHFRPKNPIDCRPLPLNLCIFGQEARSIIGHCVTHHFVFIYIVGSIFIFNIFMGQRPVSDLEKHIREPPQLAQAGIFHPLQKHRVFVVGSHQRGAILG